MHSPEGLPSSMFALPMLCNNLAADICSSFTTHIFKLIFFILGLVNTIYFYYRSLNLRVCVCECVCLRECVCVCVGGGGWGGGRTSMYKGASVEHCLNLCALQRIHFILLLILILKLW